MRIAVVLGLVALVAACSGPAATSTPSAQPSPTAPLSSATPSPGATPSPTASAGPTASPTVVPTASATAGPTASPTTGPTASPTLAPSATPSTVPSGPTIEVLAGGGTAAPAVGGTPTDAQLARPSGVAFGPDGSTWIVDANLAQIIHVAASGKIDLVQGGVLLDPEGVGIAPDGTVYVADRAIYEVLSVDPSGGWTRVAGGDHAGSSGDGHLARRALLTSPLDVAADSAGDVFIVDAAAQVVRRIDAQTGIISTIAGNGTGGFSGDGATATSAQIYGAQSIAISGSSLFIADTTNHRVRKVDLTTGIISTVAGTGDGTAVPYNPLLSGLQTPIARPNSIAADTLGNVYFPVFWGDRGTIVMRLDPQGGMTPVAGGGNSATPGGAATGFILPDVLGLAVDPASGDLAICGSDGKVYVVADVTAIP